VEVASGIKWPNLCKMLVAVRPGGSLIPPWQNLMHSKLNSKYFYSFRNRSTLFQRNEHQMKSLISLLNILFLIHSRRSLYFIQTVFRSMIIAILKDGNRVLLHCQFFFYIIYSHRATFPQLFPLE